MVVNSSAYTRWKLLLCTVLIAVAMLSLPASADWIRTRAEAKEAGSRIRVQIWLSANIGKTIIEDRYLGGYNVPAETELSATVNVGNGKADLFIETRDRMVEATVTLHVEGYRDQTDVITTPITK